MKSCAGAVVIQYQHLNWALNRRKNCLGRQHPMGRSAFYADDLGKQYLLFFKKMDQKFSA